MSIFRAIEVEPDSTDETDNVNRTTGFQNSDVELEDSIPNQSKKKSSMHLTFSLDDLEIPSKFRFESTFNDANYQLAGPKNLSDFDCEVRINNVAVELNEFELDVAEEKMDHYWRNRKTK